MAMAKEELPRASNPARLSSTAEVPSQAFGMTNAPARSCRTRKRSWAGASVMVFPPGYGSWLSRQCGARSGPHQLRVRGGGETQEDAVLAADEALAPRELVVLPPHRVVPQPGAIGFVGRKIGHGVEAVCRRARSL